MRDVTELTPPKRVGASVRGSRGRHLASLASLSPKGVRAGQAGHRVQGGRVSHEAEKKKSAPSTKVVRNEPRQL
jgi:hypothetical protein